MPGSVNGACVVRLSRLAALQSAEQQRLTNVATNGNSRSNNATNNNAPLGRPKPLAANPPPLFNAPPIPQQQQQADEADPEVSVVAFGVAFHHAALTGDERRLIEKAYRDGVLWCLCCTTTLATGVNLPTRRVIFRSIKVADQMLDSGQYRQAAGRAGRKGLDTLGESYILCRPAERLYVERQLMAPSLPPIVSNFSAERRGMVRVLLEGIATGAVKSVFDVQKAIEGTLLSAALKRPQTAGDATTMATTSVDTAAAAGPSGDVVFATARSALEFLETNQFIAWDAESNVFSATALGEAAVASSMAPDEAILLFRDLSKARRSLCLDHNAEDLQLLFLCTPYFHGIEPVWPRFHGDHYMAIPSEVRQHVCGPLLGVEEGQLFQWAMVPPRHGLGGSNTVMYGATAKQNSAIGIGGKATSNSSGGGGRADLAVLAYKRFYVALILWDVIREVPHAVICRKFAPLSRAELGRLTELASAFAAMTSSFAAALGWWFFPPLFDTMAARLSVGVEPDLLPLMKIEGLTARRARELAKKGYRSPLAVACATPQELEAILSKRAPFAVVTSGSGGEGSAGGRPAVHQQQSAASGLPTAGDDRIGGAAVGQKRSREEGAGADTPHRAAASRTLDDEAVVSVKIPTAEAATAAPSAAPPAETATAAMRFYQVDTRRLAIRIIEAAKAAVQAEAQEMSDTAAEAGIVVAVPQITGGGGVGGTSLPTPLNTSVGSWMGGNSNSNSIATVNNSAAHAVASRAAGLGLMAGAQNSRSKGGIVARSAAKATTVSWTVVDCGCALQLAVFCSVMRRVLLPSDLLLTENGKRGVWVGVHLLGSDGLTLRPSARLSSIVVSLRKEAVDGKGNDGGDSRTLAHTHVFHLGGLHTALLALPSHPASSSHSISDGAAPARPITIIRALFNSTIIENSAATLVLHDAKATLHQWRTVGLLDPDPSLDFSAAPRAAHCPHPHPSLPLAGRAKCRLFDTLVADWLLEPEDRAGGRRMSLDQLCEFHRVTGGGGGEQPLAHVGMGANNSAHAPLDTSKASASKDKADETAGYRRMPMPQLAAEAWSNAAATPWRDYAAAIGNVFHPSSSDESGVTAKPVRDDEDTLLEAAFALQAKMERGSEAHTTGTNMGVGVGANGPESAPPSRVAAALDKRAQRQQALLKRHGCAYGVRLCSLAATLSAKMRQFSLTKGGDNESAKAKVRKRHEGEGSDDGDSSDSSGDDADAPNQPIARPSFQSLRRAKACGHISASLEAYFYAIEMPLVLVLVSMEAAGIGFDPNRYEWLLAKLKSRSGELTADAFATTGHSNWELSNVQDCARMLFDVMKMPCLERTFDAQFLPKRLLKSAARGRGRGAAVARESRSTKASVLNGLAKLFPEARLPHIIKEYRTVEGWSEKYLRPLLWCWQVQQQRAACGGGGGEGKEESPTPTSTPLLATGRVHGEFLQTATATGRLSMNDPNLQTIPHPISLTMDSGEVVDVRLRQAYVAENWRGSAATTVTRPQESASAAGGEENAVVGGGNESDEDDRWVLVSADYAQIEARLLAHFSRDPKLLEAFSPQTEDSEGTKTLDVFEKLALQTFHASSSPKYTSAKARPANASSTEPPPPPPLPHITTEQRKAAKTLCYGMIYGKGAAAIADDVEVSLDEASKLLADFRATYAVATQFIEALGAETGRRGYVKTLMGRRRWLPYAGSRNPRHKAASDRIAINTLCQGSAADIIKLAMVELLCGRRREGGEEEEKEEEELKKGAHSEDGAEEVSRASGSTVHIPIDDAIRFLFVGGAPLDTDQGQGSKSSGWAPPRARLLLQIHDELVFEVRKSHLQLLAAVLASVMDVSEALSLRVPLPVRVKAGPNWADMSPVTLDGSVAITE